MAQEIAGPGVYVIEQHRHEYNEVTGLFAMCGKQWRDGIRCGAFIFAGGDVVEWGTRMYRVIDQDGEVLLDRRMESWVEAWALSKETGQPVVVYDPVERT